MKEMQYKEIMKDEKSLKEYLNQLVERDDLDVKNKVFSAALAGRFFEKDKYFIGNRDEIVSELLKEMKVDNEEDK